MTLDYSILLEMAVIFRTYIGAPVIFLALGTPDYINYLKAKAEHT